MVDHDEDGTLDACNGEYEWLMVDLEDVGVHLEISKAVVRRWGQKKEGQGRSPRDHLGLEKLSSLSQALTQEAHSFTCFISSFISQPTLTLMRGRDKYRSDCGMTYHSHSYANMDQQTNLIENEPRRALHKTKLTRATQDSTCS